MKRMTDLDRAFAEMTDADLEAWRAGGAEKLAEVIRTSRWRRDRFALTIPDFNYPIPENQTRKDLN